MAEQPLLPKVTNKEGEDLAEPLPKSWNLKALKTGSPKVVLYGASVSPPCCKIRFMLNYYGVPFESKNGKKPDSDYTKIPVLDIGDRQINDSYIVVKNLAPILQGRRLTEQEEKLEKKITFELMIALERDCASSVRDLCGCASLAGGMTGCGLAAIAPIVACCIGPNIGKDKGLVGLEDYNSYLTTELGTKPFFGGSEPTVIDVSMFGVMVPFEASGSSALKVLLGGTGTPLSKWFESMHEKSSGVKSIFD